MSEAEAVTSFAGQQMYREEQTMTQMVWRAFRRHKPAMVGLVTVVVLALAAIFAPIISPAVTKSACRTVNT